MLQEQLKEVTRRLSQVEAKSSTGASSGPDRRHTLVFGGWAGDTRRGVLLAQLKQGLQGLQLWDFLDNEPFCTGARRSVALCNFRWRPSESDDEPRSRMLRVLQVINASQVALEGAVKPLWCSFSKSPEERGRASLAAVVRKVILKFAPNRIQDLDINGESMDQRRPADRDDGSTR